MDEDDVIKGMQKKINLIGDPGVGKTSLIKRFIEQDFDEEELSETDSGVYEKQVPLLDEPVNLALHDLKTGEESEEVFTSLFRQSQGAVAVADATRKETLQNLANEWIPLYKTIANTEAPIVLAVNKDDLEDKEIDERSVTEDIEIDYDYFFFTSSKTGKNVDEIFYAIASKTLSSTVDSEEVELDELMPEDGLEDPKRFLRTLLVYYSEPDALSHADRKQMLEESEIEAPLSSEDVKEEKAIEFARGLLGWYEEHGDDESVEYINKLMKRYKSGSEEEDEEER